jgi:hypothetical protein
LVCSALRNDEKSFEAWIKRLNLGNESHRKYVIPMSLCKFLKYFREQSERFEEVSVKMKIKTTWLQSQQSVGHHFDAELKWKNITGSKASLTVCVRYRITNIAGSCSKPIDNQGKVS